MATKVTSPKLTWLEGARRAEELLAREGLPEAKKPTHLLGREYDFPTDPNILTSMQLGRIKLEMASLRGHVQSILGKQEIILHELEMVLDFMIPLEMLELVRSEEFRKLPRAALVKEVLRAAAIERNPLIKRLFHRTVETKLIAQRLRVQYEIYEGHYAALSREQSRREALARGGIPE